MRTGTAISGTAHVGFALLAVFGGPLFESDTARAIPISTVSVISADEFSAAVSSAPEAPPVEVPELGAPSESGADTATPDSDSAVTRADNEQPEAPELRDDAPDVSGLDRQPTPEVAVESPGPAPGAFEAPQGFSAIVPDRVGTDVPVERPGTSNVAIAEPAPPRPAPRVDTTPAPPPPPEALPDDQVQEEVAEGEPSAELEEEQQATAPEESATEIVPEAPEDAAPETPAPLNASRPRGRPDSVVARAEEARQQAAAEAEETRDIASNADPAPSEAPAETPARTPAAVGPPLSGREKSGLSLAISDCWNVPVGVRNAAELVVVVAVELGADGALVGQPRLIEPRDASAPGISQAFQAARRAVIRCAPYTLPREKFAHWRNLEIEFNPRNMTVR